MPHQPGSCTEILLVPFKGFSYSIVFLNKGYSNSTGMCGESFRNICKALLELLSGTAVAGQGIIQLDECRLQ